MNNFGHICSRTVDFKRFRLSSLTSFGVQLTKLLKIAGADTQIISESPKPAPIKSYVQTATIFLENALSFGPTLLAETEQSLV